MEIQCKERVQLLEALRQSRKDAKKSEQKKGGYGMSYGEDAVRQEDGASGTGIGQGTIPALNYPDISRPAPPVPQRPSMASKKSSDSAFQRSRPEESGRISSPSFPTPPTLPVPQKQISRSPSPEKKRTMLTTLRTRDAKKGLRSPRSSGGKRAEKPPAASKAAGLAWDSNSRVVGSSVGQSLPEGGSSSISLSTARPTFLSYEKSAEDQRHSENMDARQENLVRPRSPSDFIPNASWRDPRTSSDTFNSQTETLQSQIANLAVDSEAKPTAHPTGSSLPPLPPSQHADNNRASSSDNERKAAPKVPRKPPVEYLTYRSEYLPPDVSATKIAATAAARPLRKAEDRDGPSLSNPVVTKERQSALTSKGITRRPAPYSSTPRKSKAIPPNKYDSSHSDTAEDSQLSNHERASRRKREKKAVPATPGTPPSTDRESPDDDASHSEWEQRKKHLLKHLPKGIDDQAAKQILNEIVVQGDEVHWEDIAGLEIAKKALKEAVVYPFLRPDLFMGLREPARGMLLFGPPGTGKTMLARAVATESKSTFFAISASSLTSKWLGESEKLVRALFALARALAPSIIFVDEIDSLLSARAGSSEHETSRRIKTEFLIQWSDLQRAAAGRDQTEKEKKEGDASRVLVLAATNMPWAIDEAARRRFVRRQYIPLPEGPTRGQHLRTLISHQNHDLSEEDIQVLIHVTDGKD